MLTAVLPAVTLMGGLVAGTAAGATLGIFKKKSLGISTDERKKISDVLKGDQVLVLALAEYETEAKGLLETLTNNGGTNAGSNGSPKKVLPKPPGC